MKQLTLTLTAIALIAILGACSEYELPAGSTPKPPRATTQTTATAQPASTNPLATSTPFPTVSVPSEPPARPPDASTLPDSYTALPLEISPRIGSNFEKLLSMLPVNETTQNFTQLTDIGGVMDAVGIERLPQEATREERQEFLEGLITGRSSTGIVPKPNWPSEQLDYRSKLNTYPDLAFDFTSIEAFAYSSIRSWFGSSESNGYPVSYEVAIGQFNPAATAAALTNCDCDQPEIREHEGIEYYLWGPGDRSAHLSDRHKRPLYDHVGRGPYLLVREGEAYYNISPGIIDEHIDIINAAQPSLANNPGYLGAIRWITATGITSNIYVIGNGFTVNDNLPAKDPSVSVTITDAITGELIPTVAPSAIETDIHAEQLLHPFDFVAAGIGYDGEEGFISLVLSHPDTASAEANHARLLKRIDSVVANRRGTGETVTWSQMVDTIEIKTSDRFLIARIYATSPEFFGYLLGEGTLLIHE